MKKIFLLFTFLFVVFCGIDVFAQHRRTFVSSTDTITYALPKSWKRVLQNQDESFYKTDEARRIGDQLLLYQRVTGGWEKNVDVVRPLSENERAKVLADKNKTDDSTIDNGSTTIQMFFLARLYQATKDEKYRDAFEKGVEFLLSGQYKNGGWPQFWPNPKGYQTHITYNDDAMINTLCLFRDMAKEKSPFDNGLSTPALRKRLQKSIDMAVDIIVKTQIITDGVPTVWCQQHDCETLLPAKARAYELPSYCSAESAGIVKFLMSIEKPSAKVKTAIHSAMTWFDKYKITGYKIKRVRLQGGQKFDTRLVEDANALPLWSRYYDLKGCEPYVCDRDGLPRRSLEQIGEERRNGYGWYSDSPNGLYKLYDAWAEKNDPKGKVKLDHEGPGGNETGLFSMFRQPKVDESLFDAIVSRGESIQDALDKAPSNATLEQPYCILVKNGLYNEKVIIDKPNIVLVGQNRDSCIIVGAETADHMIKSTFNGKPVHQGIVVLTENADDCVLSGLTILNNFGTTVTNTTTHQMAVYGSATRTIIVNCNINSDGNDALSLWAKGGMYYHADLYLRCPGVDFICPRGTCYATRCSFYGDTRAILWHDGRGDKNEKFVITNSKFDARKPTVLGRYHHDSQFFIINCEMTANILDKTIEHAYKYRKAPHPGEVQPAADPCPWGQRVYFYGCHRDGGHSGWLNNNLDQAPGAPEFHGITAQWTFGGKWNPEERLRKLWPCIAY